MIIFNFKLYKITKNYLIKKSMNSLMTSLIRMATVISWYCTS